MHFIYAQKEESIYCKKVKSIFYHEKAFDTILRQDKQNMNKSLKYSICVFPVITV